MNMKALAWIVIAAQLIPNIVVARPTPHAGRALVLKIAHRLARSDLFKGPEGMARLESAVQKTMDRQASRIEKAVAHRSDEELLEHAEATLKHARKTGKTVLESRMRTLLAFPENLRNELIRELDPALRDAFMIRVHEQLTRAGSVEALVNLIAAGGDGEDCQCWNFQFSYTEVATGLLSLIWDGLDGAPPKTLLWAIPLLIAVAVIGVPVAFLADTLIFFPIWFFGEHMDCEHGG